MKPIYYLVAILLMSCSSPEQAESSNEKPTPSTGPISNTEELEEEWDEEAILQKNTEEFEQLMLTKRFDYYCANDCNPGAANHDEVMEHKGKAFFKTEKIINDSSIFIQYRFVSDCCKTFGGDYEFENDTLKLIDYSLGAVACDCRCVYEYAFNLPNKGWEQNVITINGAVLE